MHQETDRESTLSECKYDLLNDVLGIIADNLSEAGWSLGWVSALDVEGRTLWIVDAHACGKRFIIRTDEMLTPFLELETARYTRSR